MNLTRRNLLGRLATLSLATLALSRRVDAQNQQPRVVEVQIEGRHVIVPEDAIKVTEGETIELHWSSDELVELHLHGYDMELTVTPGETAVLALEAFASGRFPITSHGWGKGGHAHDALTFLEVHPN